MATISDGELFLENRLASEEQLRRGLTAARTYLEAAGVDFWAAFDASWKPEYVDDQGEGEMTTEEWQLAEAWWNAEKAAMNSIAVGAPSDTRLCMLKLHEETMARLKPELIVVPPIDPGPHYSVSRDSLVAA